MGNISKVSENRNLPPIKFDRRLTQSIIEKPLDSLRSSCNGSARSSLDRNTNVSQPNINTVRQRAAKKKQF